MSNVYFSAVEILSAQRPTDISAVTTVLIKTSVVKYNERTSVNTSYHINNIRETTTAVETKGIVGREKN